LKALLEFIYWQNIETTEKIIGEIRRMGELMNERTLILSYKKLSLKQKKININKLLRV
jgi:hypothetical protein